MSGLRQVADVMAEMSLALIDPIVYQTLTAPVASGSAVTIPVASTDYLYPGAQVVLGWQGANAEVITVIAVLSDTAFTANVLNAHLTGEYVFGATFSAQVPTDPIFIQSEIIGYIAQAQNEFLAKVPLIFEFFNSNLVTVGQAYQTASNTVIEMERVSVQSTPSYASFPIANIGRGGGGGFGQGGFGEGGFGGAGLGSLVTCVLSSSVNADQWTPGLEILVFGVADTTYNSANNQMFALESVSADGLTLTWAQSGSESVSTGGVVQRPVYTRLYESSQEQIAMQNPWWQSQSGIPKSWWEDRAGLYGWGIAPPPNSNYYLNYLASTRASESLGMLDGFLVPDCFVYAIKWRALAYAWSKDGVQRSPTLERFAKGKFDFYCLLADRFMRNAIEKTGPMGAAMGGNF